MSSPNTYGMDAAQFDKIIQVSQDSLERMQRVNGQLQMHAGEIMRVNNSVSGRVLTNTFNEWNSDFAKITAALDELKNKSINLKQYQPKNTDDAANRAGN